MAYCDCREELGRAYATISGDPSASADRAAHGRTSNLYFAWPILAHLEEARGGVQVQGLLLRRRMESEKEGVALVSIEDRDVFLRCDSLRYHDEK